MDDQENRLSGKVALVTGAARRVGRAVAVRLARAGMDVAVTYRTSAKEAEDVVAEIRALGRRACAIEVDLAADDAAEVVHAGFTGTFETLYALVNNASFFDPTPVASVTREAFDRNMAVNVRAPLFLIQKFAPFLTAHETPGRVVNFIDIHVMGQPLKGFVAYNAAKAALKEVTMTLAMELAPHATVNALAPGVVAWAPSYTEAERQAYLRRVPLGRPGTPEDAATAALYLIRDADYSTGQILCLDGGRLLT
jgi:pteridine reductase